MKHESLKTHVTLAGRTRRLRRHTVAKHLLSYLSFLLPLVSCSSDTTPPNASEPGLVAGKQRLNSEILIADNSASPPMYINPQKGHEFATRMALTLLDERGRLPPVYKGDIGVGSTTTQADKRIAKTDLIYYGVDFADHPWMGRPSSPAEPVQNPLTDSFGRASNNCATHPNTCDIHQSTHFDVSIDTDEQIAALGIAALLASTGPLGWIFGGLLGIGAETVRPTVTVDGGYTWSNSIVGNVASNNATPARYDSGTRDTYFRNFRPTIVPLSYFNIRVTDNLPVGASEVIKQYALDNMFHYSHGDISLIAAGNLPANVFPNIKMYPFVGNDPDVVGKAVKDGVSFVSDFVKDFGGQTIMSGADYGVERYGSILFQMSTRFFPGSSQEPALANMVKAGHRRDHWSTGGVTGDPGGKFSDFRVTYPDTNLGGNPFICANGSHLENPCADGAATWPVWVPRTYSGPSEAWLAELQKDKPGRSLRAALIYLGWALHLVQDSATPHHAANWSGFEHDRQDGLGDSVEDAVSKDMAKQVVTDGYSSSDAWLKYYMSRKDGDTDKSLDDLLGPAAQPKPVSQICAEAGLTNAGVTTGEIDWNKGVTPFVAVASDGLKKQIGIDYSTYNEKKIDYMLPYLRNATRASIVLLLCAPPADAAGGNASSADSYADRITDGPVPAGWAFDPTLGPVSNIVAGAISDKDDGDEGAEMTCPAHTLARGILCKGQDCDDMYLACGTASATIDAGPAFWTNYTSEESSFLPADCGDGFAIDGMRAKGSYSDNVKLHCVKVTQLPIPTGCHWDPYTTGYVSSDSVPWSYWGEYAQSMKCYDSHCAKMTFKGFRVLCGGVTYGSHPVDEGTIGALRTGREFYSAYVSDETVGHTCQDNIDPTRFDRNKTLARGIRCEHDYCDNMTLACAESPVTIVHDSAHPDYWTPYISEESPNNEANCGEGYAIDGVRASGSYSDNVSFHCVKITLDPAPGGCRWAGAYWTGWVSDEGAGNAYWGAYSQAVRCMGRYCDNMSFYAYRLICEDNDPTATGNIPNGWLGSVQWNVDTGAAATQSKVVSVSDENGNAGHLCGELGQGLVLRGVRCNNSNCDNILMSCGPSDIVLDPSDVHWTGDDAWSRGYTSEEFPPADCGQGYAVDGIRATGSYSDNIQLHCVRIARKNTLPDNCAWSPNPYWTTWVSEEEPNYHYAGQWIQQLKCSGSYCDNMSLLAYYSYCTPPGTGSATPPGGGGDGAAWNCVSQCSQQTQSDLKMCQDYLTCYQTNTCNPSTCGAPDQTCGVNKIGGGTAPKQIADKTYACLQMIGSNGSVVPPTSNACLTSWRTTSCGAFCTGQTQSDRLMCQQYLDCYNVNACGSNSSCASQDSVCGVNKIGGGTVGKTIADLVYQCLKCG